MASPDRLDTIESKLDRLSEVVIQLARIEERMYTVFRRMNNYEKNSLHDQSRIRTLETEVQDNKANAVFGERIFWLVVTASISTLFYFLR